MTCWGWLCLFLSQLEKRAELCLGMFLGHLRAASSVPLLGFFSKEKEGNRGLLVHGLVSCYRPGIDLEMAHVGLQSQQLPACPVAFPGSVPPPQPDEITALEKLVVFPPKLGSPPSNSSVLHSGETEQALCSVMENHGVVIEVG